jgi:hypothetical protein
LEIEEIALFLVAFSISGLICYKTFQWARYEEIGIGLAIFFFGVAIVCFFSITNYHLIRDWRLSPAGNVKGATQSYNDSVKECLERIRPVLAKQTESIEALSRIVSELEGSGNSVNSEVKDIAGKAMETAQQANEQSRKFGSVGAWAIWDGLIVEYSEVEDYLSRWEERNTIEREAPPAESKEELEKRLTELAKRVELPHPIQSLYHKRHRKYEILKRLDEEFGQYVTEFVRVELSLPAPPKLPSGLVSEEASTNAISER